jgi:hypothetical protein
MRSGNNTRKIARNTRGNYGFGTLDPSGVRWLPSLVCSRTRRELASFQRINTPDGPVSENAVRLFVQIGSGFVSASGNDPITHIPDPNDATVIAGCGFGRFVKPPGSDCSGYTGRTHN